MKALIADQELVTELLPMTEAIEVMRKALTLLAEGDVINGPTIFVGRACPGDPAVPAGGAGRGRFRRTTGSLLTLSRGRAVSSIGRAADS